MTLYSRSRFKLFRLVFLLIFITGSYNAESGEISEVDINRATRNKKQNINKSSQQNSVPENGLLQNLHKAAAQNNIKKIKLLLSDGADVNLKDNDGYTPLFYAIWQRNVDMANLFISHRAEVNLFDETNSTPLHYAVWSADMDMIKLLVEKGADINAGDRKDKTPLQYAIGHMKGNLVDLLLAGETMYPTLHLSAAKGDLAGIKSFIEKGINIDEKDTIGWTPFLWAASTGRINVCQFLISKGDNVNAKNQDGVTPLHVACLFGQKDVAKLLIRKNVDINAKADEGFTPLHIAALRGNEEIIKLLLDKEASVNEKNQDGETPLHLACGFENKTAVELIIEKGADVNVKDNEGSTPLHIAAIRGNEEIVEILLAKGADVNAKNNNGRTALSIASNQGRTEIVELLHNFETEAQTLIIYIDMSQNSLNLKAIYGSDIKEYSTPVDIEAPAKLEYLYKILKGKKSEKERYGDVNDLLSDLGESIYGPIENFLNSASEINLIIKEELIKYPLDLLRYKGHQLFLIKPVFYSFQKSEPHQLQISPDWTGFIASDVTADPERGCLLVKAMFPTSRYFDVWAISPKDIEKMENLDFILISTHGQISDMGNDVMRLGDEEIVPKNFSGKKQELVYFDSCNLGVSIEFIEVFRSNGTFYYLGPITGNQAGDSSTKTINFFFQALFEGSTPPAALFETRKQLYEIFNSQDDFYELMLRVFPFRLYQLN
ncbi:MAG: hypothetical protein GWN67_28130 [Phycisphaerae bacterium]|nr:hypothetical protein [Phycisphaerae bacterium]NIP56171.1 hypothetical protein [Phycisphaerae bacterium]NIS54632.1 hypothetical protein [Phycisphaerae bacterium]NIU12244.1 hypothetical protein [Phycisphaerae bacterium]NIU60090.1 hypothetical protein [Phycisphaerae bacterium]